MSCRRGYTLLEVAAVFVIVGLVLTASLWHGGRAVDMVGRMEIDNDLQILSNATSDFLLAMDCSRIQNIHIVNRGRTGGQAFNILAMSSRPPLPAHSRFNDSCSGEWTGPYMDGSKLNDNIEEVVLFSGVDTVLGVHAEFIRIIYSILIPDEDIKKLKCPVASDWTQGNVSYDHCFRSIGGGTTILRFPLTRN